VRIARHTYVGIVHHVISRFVDREWFIRDDEERAVYLKLFGRALAKTDWRCLAYCVMSNHIHLAMLPGERPLESWAKPVNSRFARWMNQRHGRLGPIFADRPRSHAIAAHNQANLIAYIHNNPVRAGVARRASESGWSSHLAFLGLAPRPRWLDVDAALALCGFDDVNAFDRWVTGSPHIEIEHPDVAEVRKAVRRRGAIEVATPCEQTVALVRRPQSLIRPAPFEIVAVVADIAGIDVAKICSRTSRPRAVSARRVVFHIAVRFGLTLSDLSAVLGVSPQAGSKLSRQTLTATETELRDAAEAAGIKGRFTSTMARVMIDLPTKEKRAVRRPKVSR
jgi:REP element-mobilizing transposase RayT